MRRYIGCKHILRAGVSLQDELPVSVLTRTDLALHSGSQSV